MNRRDFIQRLVATAMSLWVANRVAPWEEKPEGVDDVIHVWPGDGIVEITRPNAYVLTHGTLDAAKGDQLIISAHGVTVVGAR